MLLYTGFYNKNEMASRRVHYSSSQSSFEVSPACVFYIVVAFIGIFVDQTFHRFNMLALVVQLAFLLGWSYIVNSVSRANYSLAAWLIAFAPFLFFFIYK